MKKYPMQPVLVPEVPEEGEVPAEGEVPEEGEGHAATVDEFIKSNVSGAYHLSSTCRMSSLDEGGVVDLQLRVYGVQGLRVADASVFPELIGMKPQATIVMVGEKCAELLIAEAKTTTTS